MQRLGLEEYLSAPAGRWTLGDGWLHFCAESPLLPGAIVWGTCNPDVTAALFRCASAASTLLPEQHPALVDGRRTRTIDLLSFRFASDYLAHLRSGFRDRVVQLAAVRPTGITGVIAEGFFRMVPPPCPMQVFAERGESLRWLGCEAHAALIDDIEGHARAARSDREFLSELRAALERQLVDASIESVAKHLATSVRTLQRRLRAEGTSFHRELNAARVRAAQRLLLESDASMGRIASDVGFTPATFAAAFRRYEGVNPREWLEVHRRR